MGRPIIAGFLKDKSLGSKRLASMPDRMTNTIQTTDGGGAVCRPTVINCYDQATDSREAWWGQWREFLFRKQVSVKTKKGVEEKLVYKLLAPISKAKYPVRAASLRCPPTRGPTHAADRTTCRHDAFINFWCAGVRRPSPRPRRRSACRCRRCAWPSSTRR